MAIALQISQLSKVYDNSFQALKGIDLQVEEGDFFALLGPNGAGKSTTIGVLTSLVRKTAGSVQIFGLDTDVHFSTIKQQLGVVPQEFNFNPFEQVYNVVYTQAGFYGIASKEAHKRTEHYLKKLSLWDKRDEQARLLSGGMKRRLMIARALIHEPKLLILDEPTAGVDIEVRRSMWEFLQEINALGTTIILTTHYLEEAESLCRNIAIIDGGKIVENTSMRELLSQLQVETFVLDVDAKAFSQLDLHSYQVNIVDEHSVEVQVEKGVGLNTLFQQLSAAGIEVSSMRNKSNRLEELFMRLVGSEDETTQGSV